MSMQASAGAGRYSKCLYISMHILYHDYNRKPKHHFRVATKMVLNHTFPSSPVQFL